MAGFLRCLVHFLCCSILLVNGQYTVCTDAGSKADEDIMSSLEEHALKLNILGEQFLSTFRNLESNVKRTIVRGFEDHDENVKEALQNLTSGFVNDLQKMEMYAENRKYSYRNTSIKSEKIEERIQNNECLKVGEKMQLLMGLILNWSSKVEKIDKSLHAVNETLEKKLEEPSPRLISLFRNLSAGLDSIYTKYDIMQTVISKKREEHGKKLELIDQDLSSNFKSTNESLLRVLENDKKIHQTCEELSSMLQAINVSTARSSRDQESKSQEKDDLYLKILDDKLSSTVGNFEANVNRSVSRCLEEHDENLRAVLRNLSSTFENGDTKLVRELEKHTQIMKDIYHNTTIKIEEIDEIIQDNECLRVEERKEFLKGMILNWSSKVEKIDEGIEAVNETLERKLAESNRGLINLYQNLSARLDNIDARFDTLHRTISMKVEENAKKLELMDKGLSSNFKSTNESLLRVIENDEKIQQMYERLSSRLQSMNESMVRSPRDGKLKLPTIHENFTSTIGKFYEKLNDVLDLVNQSIQIAKQENLGNRDCSTIKRKDNTTSGVHRISVDYRNTRYYANAFCDMTTTSGDWTVFQRRINGTENFFRGWDDYAKGFGDPHGEFWLGNDFLHYLTSMKSYKLRVDLEDFSGNKRYAEYSTFSISSSADKYRLAVGTYSGNAGNSLSYHTCMQFSTRDQENNANNCSNTEHGAWWYGHCHNSNLNGRYYFNGNYHLEDDVCNADGIAWKDWLGFGYSLKTTEMKISPID